MGPVLKEPIKEAGWGGAGNEHLNPGDMTLIRLHTACYNSTLGERQGRAPNSTIYNAHNGDCRINDFTYERGTMMR